MNVKTPRMVANDNYQKILQCIEQNISLSQKFAYVNKDDIEAVLSFMEDVIVGKASSEVPAMYCLGSINDKVQIRISTKDDNKDLPLEGSSSWKDFYDNSNTAEKNLSILLDATSQNVQSRLSKHVSEFHMDNVLAPNTQLWLESQGFFLKDNFDPSLVKTQKFFDHDYCVVMNGFDYATSFRRQGRQWCRVWRSGYVEQGGFVSNTSKSLIQVKFMEHYNYPDGAMFYQRGWNELADDSRTVVKSSISQSRRYIAIVTPVKRNDVENAYPERKSYDGEVVHSSVDIANISNEGFSFFNADPAGNVYSGYSWHVCGYRS